MLRLVLFIAVASLISISSVEAQEKKPQTTAAASAKAARGAAAVRRRGNVRWMPLWCRVQNGGYVLKFWATSFRVNL